MATSYSEFVVPLLRSLRDEILQAYGNIDSDYKEDNSVVTEIDRKIEKKLIKELSTKYPDTGFLGEESGQRGDKDTYWLIDPIDGTENYVRGLPGVTSILGLVENDEVVQSYIYDPVEDVMYSAFKGMGAYRDGEKITVSKRPVNKSFLNIGDRARTQYPDLAGFIRSKGMRHSGQFHGIGMVTIYMVSGKIDGVITYGLKGGGLWDYAPTAFMLREAGGIFTSFDGKMLHSRVYSIFTPANNEAILSGVKEIIDA